MQVLAPENEAFRLGIQKCHNTIQDNVKDGEVFNVPGASILFRMLCSAQEMHSDSSGVHKMKRAPTLKGLLTNMAIKKEDKGPDGCETGGKTLGQALDLNKLREVANIIEEETIQFDAEEANKEKNAKLEEMKQKGRRYDPKKIKKKAAAKVSVKIV